VGNNRLNTSVIVGVVASVVMCRVLLPLVLIDVRMVMGTLLIVLMPRAKPVGEEVLPP
jgi:hypothetical protein